MTQRQFRLVVAAVVAGLVAGACGTFSVDPKAIGSIEFPPFRNPAIIAGDSLRDTSGVPVPLTAKVFSAAGDLLPDAQPVFVALDTLVRIEEGDFLSARAGVTGTARLTATIGGLQSGVRLLAVVVAPDTLAATVALRDTIEYHVPPTLADTSMALVLRLRSAKGTPVPNYLITWRVIKGGIDLPATDTSKAFSLIGQNGRGAVLDTSDAGGAARRKLRFRFDPAQPPDDSVVVRADVRAGRNPVTGSPVQFVILVRPKQ